MLLISVSRRGPGREPVRELERDVGQGVGVTGKCQLELREWSQFAVTDAVAVFFLSLLFPSKLFISQHMIFTFCAPKSPALGRGRSEQVAHSLEWFQWEQ